MTDPLPWTLPAATLKAMSLAEHQPPHLNRPELAEPAQPLVAQPGEHPIDPHHDQALRRAVKKGRLAEVERLIPLTHFHADGHPALKAAVGRSQLACLQMLLAAHPVSDKGWAHLLNQAVRHSPKDSSILAALLAEAPAPVKALQGPTLLRHAVEKGHLEAVLLLLPLCPPNSLDVSLLDMGPYDKGIVDALLNVIKAPPQTNHRLSSAAMHGDLTLVEALIPISDPNDWHAEPLWRAADQGHTAVVERLAQVTEVGIAMDYLIELNKWPAIAQLAPYVSLEKLEAVLKFSPEEAGENARQILKARRLEAALHGAIEGPAPSNLRRRM